MGGGDLAVEVRYARELADPDVDQREHNLSFGKLQWRMRTDECSIVLVDCWADYPLKSFVERASEICVRVIAPLLSACRHAGVAVIHAPSPEWAANYPEFTAPEVSEAGRPRSRDRDHPGRQTACRHHAYRPTG